MTRDNIWDGFCKLFPDYVKHVESYRKIGSKTIELTMDTADENGEKKKLIFLYNDPWDWTFGSKVWRARPRKQRVDFSNVDLEEDDLK
jgi:hypothetical protein